MAPVTTAVILSVLALLVGAALILSARAIQIAQAARLFPKQVRELVEEMEVVLDKWSIAQARERQRRKAERDRVEAEPPPDIQGGAATGKAAIAARAMALGIRPGQR